MTITINLNSLAPRRMRSLTNLPAKNMRRVAIAAAALCLSTASFAVDFGPFSLNGFAEARLGRDSNQCDNCQWVIGEEKQREWADELIPGSQYKSESVTFTQFQPYLGVKFDLGKGYKLSGLLSQRWRDGEADIPGFFYERNVALSNEEYGSVRIGGMTTRSWSVADYPYGTNLNVAEEWASSGAGYGLLTRALRVTTRPLDVAEGDLVLEATYDKGDTGFKKNKPRFWELYAQFHRGDLVMDAVIQDTRNGTPSAWGHGPFTGLTPFPENDSKLGSSGQSIAMLMARYQVDSKIEVSGGIRRNRWSGAYAAIVQPGAAITPTGQKDIWNSMFNVDWTNDLGGGVYRGYEATSTDLLLGARYRMGQWVASTGLVYLGKASTANPMERGQSNSALINTVGLEYDYGQGLKFNTSAGMVHYDQLGLSPMSMPGNAAFTNVDSRVNRNGTWLSVGVVYAF